LPDIQSTLVNNYGPNGVIDQGLVAVALDNDTQDMTDPAAIGAFVANQGVEFPVAFEDLSTLTYSQIEGIYDGSNPYPVDILIDKNGIMRYIAREYDPAALEAKVIELLAE
jgi:hypothetical protein